MVTSEIKVEVNQFLPDFLALMEKVEGRNVFPQTLAAFNQIAIMYQKTWREFAGGAPMPGVPRTINSRGDYIRSIQADLTGDDKIVYTDSPSHRFIESDRAEVDLKEGLLSGPKARTTKEGLPYNIVHFRHGTPATSASNRPMPLNIFNLLKKESKAAAQQKQQVLSVIRSTQPRSSTYGVKISSNVQQGKKTQMYTKYTWKSSPYAGMVRMQTSTGKAKSSQYITFRVVSKNSDPRSWILPPMQGIPIREIVVKTVKPIAEELVREALKEDLSG